MDGRIEQFNKYLVMYESNENKTGIKGIRGDAPKSVIEAFIDWYRDTYRYDNGRKYDKHSKKITGLILDVGCIA